MIREEIGARKCLVLVVVSPRLSERSYGSAENEPRRNTATARMSDVECERLEATQAKMLDRSPDYLLAESSLPSRTPRKLKISRVRRDGDREA